MAKKRKNSSMLVQIAILLLAGVILTGVFTTIVLHAVATANVEAVMSAHSDEVAQELEGYLNKYPARDWLLGYWYENYDKLDVVYDAAHTAGTKTAEDLAILVERNPGFSAEFATEKDVKALSEEDQKLYAEIIYSRLITRIDEMARVHILDYLMCVVSDEPYDSQFVLFIANKDGLDRGSEIYPIGKVINSTGTQVEAMKQASDGKATYSFNEDQTYQDYYYSIGSANGHHLFICVTDTFNKVLNASWKQTRVLTALAVFFLIILAVIFLLMILFTVLRPLKKVQKSIHLYKDSKDSAAVIQTLASIRSHNELAQLSDDVIELATEMDEYTEHIEKITSDKERIDTELNLAARIQKSMVPGERLSSEEGVFTVSGSMDPARMVGGDFYDFFLVDDDHLCLFIADVSGKGIPAALFMMASKITLTHNIKAGKSPAQVLTDTNASISAKNPAEMFVTVWLGILELSTGKLTAANAGHEYPVYMQAGGDFELFKDKHGFVVGGMEGLKYKDYEIIMEPGSKLFVYTDGLPEANDSEENMFGMDRAVEALNNNKTASPDEILDNMKDAVNDFVKDAEQFDDLTMMCLSFEGPAK